MIKGYCSVTLPFLLECAPDYQIIFYIIWRDLAFMNSFKYIHSLHYLFIPHSFTHSSTPFPFFFLLIFTIFLLIIPLNIYKQPIYPSTWPPFHPSTHPLTHPSIHCISLALISSTYSQKNSTLQHNILSFPRHNFRHFLRGPADSQ